MRPDKISIENIIQDFRDNPSGPVLISRRSSQNVIDALEELLVRRDGEGSQTPCGYQSLLSGGTWMPCDASDVQFMVAQGAHVRPIYAGTEYLHGDNRLSRGVPPLALAQGQSRRIGMEFRSAALFLDPIINFGAERYAFDLARWNVAITPGEITLTRITKGNADGQ